MLLLLLSALSGLLSTVSFAYDKVVEWGVRCVRGCGPVFEGMRGGKDNAVSCLLQSFIDKG